MSDMINSPLSTHKKNNIRPTVSVIVPSYNYAKYLPERLNSILQQTYPVSEFIIMDDGSTDNSQAVIRQWLSDTQTSAIEIFSKKNIKHTLWERGLNSATGDLIWIAEADDSAHPDFLKNLTAQFEANPEIAFVFCDSIAIDAQGKILNSNYRKWLATLGDQRILTGGIFEGIDFHRSFLAVQNTVINSSSVLWSTRHLREVYSTYADKLKHSIGAGDWMIYIGACHMPSAKIAFVPQSLNMHRRHTTGITFGQSRFLNHLREVSTIHEISQSLLGPSTLLDQRRTNFLRSLRANLCKDYIPSPTLDIPASHAPASAPITEAPPSQALSTLPPPKTWIFTKNPLFTHTICQVSLEKYPSSKNGLIGFVVDCLQEGWFDPQTKTLALNFQVVLVHPAGSITDLHLFFADTQTRITLHPSGKASPGMGRNHPTLPWASNSRFHIYETCTSPSALLTTCELRGVVTGSTITVCNVHIRPIPHLAYSSHLKRLESVLLVSGMRYGGTSVVAELCAAMGLLPPQSVKNITQIHDQLFLSCNRPWFDMRPLPEGWLDSTVTHQTLEEITDVVAACFTTAGTTALIEEDRIGLLEPLWEKVQQQHSWRFYHLFIIRPVHEVAAALLKRDHVNPRIAAAMWWIQVTRILRSIRHKPHAIITYAQAIQHPTHIHRLLTEQLGLNIPSLQQGLQNSPTQPSPDLQHHCELQTELLHDALADHCNTLYLKLSHQNYIPPELTELLQGYPEWVWLFSRHHQLLKTMHGLRDTLSQTLDGESA